MSITAIVRDALARIVRAREALADGDSYYLEAILEDLEHDLAGWLAANDLRVAA